MEKFGLPKQEKTAWQSFQEIAKVAALSALVALLGAENAMAKDNGGSHEKTKIKIENLKSKIADEEKKVEKIAAEKGMSGYVNGLKSEMFKAKSGDVITVIHLDNGKTTISLKSKDGTLTYLDRENKGFVNRIVVDNEQGKSRVEEGARRAFDDVDAYSSMDSLAETASVESDMEPKDKAVHEISEHQGNFSIQTINFKNGEKTVLEGSEASRLASKIEDSFLVSLEAAEK